MTVAPDWALAIPTPGIHNPPGGGGPLPTPIPLQQLGATMQFFLDVFIGKIAIAFGGIEILGWHPFQFLADWGQARIDQANANYLLAATADGKAQDALDFIAQMVDGILGTGHTVGDFVDWLQDTSANATTSIAQWNSIISGLAVGDFSGLLAFFESIPTSIADAASDANDALSKLVNVSVAGIYDAAAGFGNVGTSLLKFLTPTGGNIGQFDATGLAGALGGALTFGGTALSTFFGNINSSGGLLASGLTGAFNGAVTLGGNSFTNLLQYLNSSGQFAAGQLTGAINGSLTLGGVTLSTLVTNINSSGQLLAAGITGALGTGLTVGGVTLSTLFTNINSSGQLLLSGATGALNTAVTIGGQTVSSIFNGSGQFIGVINSSATGALNTALTVAGQQIGTVQANAQGLVEGINNAAAGVVSGASSLLADAATNIQLLFGGAPQNLQGLTGVYGQSATNAAYAAVAAAASAQAAEQTRINSAFNAVFNVSPATAGNVNQTVDFSGIANQTGMSGIMLPGSGSGAGYLGVTGGQAVWQGGTVSPDSVSGADIEVFPTQTTSDYQVVTVTLGSLNDTPANSGGVSALIVARCNSARDTFVSLLLYGSGGNLAVQMRYRSSGSDNPFSGGSVTALITTAASGGVLKWIIGDPSSSSPYAMQVLYNGTPIITFTDSSHVSAPALGQKYVGLGAGVGTAQAGKVPVGIRSITYQDNPPPSASYPFSGTPTAGTKGRMYVSNDVGLIQRDNGTAWERVWGGPLGWFTAPPSSGWSSVNAGTTSFAADKDAMLLTAPSVASGETPHSYVRTLSPSSNYTARFYIETTAMIFGTTIFSITLRDSSNSRITNFCWGVDTADVGIGFGDSAGWFVNVHTRAGTSFNSVLRNSAVRWLAGGALPNWWQIRDDGSVRYYEYSINGVDFETFYSESRTTWVTPNQIGFSAYNGNSGYPIYLRVRSLSGIS